MLVILWTVSGNSMTIIFAGNQKNQTIYKDGQMMEALLPNREDAGTCHPVPRFRVGPTSRSVRIIVENIEYPSHFETKVTRNSNQEIATPRLIWNKAGDQVDAELIFACKSLDYDVVPEPWTFIAVQMGDNQTWAEFELLKLCDDQFYRGFNWGVLLLLILVLAIVALSSLTPIPISTESDAARAEAQEAEMGRTNFKAWHALAFVLLGSLTLVLAFLFPRVLLWVLTVLLAIQGVMLFTPFLFQVGLRLFKSCQSFRAFLLRHFIWDCITVAEFIAFLISVSLMVSWAVTKHWILNNILAVMYQFCFLRLIRINSFFVSTILLALLFGYDIFWVFYSGSFFG